MSPFSRRTQILFGVLAATVISGCCHDSQREVNSAASSHESMLPPPYVDPIRIRQVGDVLVITLQVRELEGFTFQADKYCPPGIKTNHESYLALTFAKPQGTQRVSVCYFRPNSVHEVDVSVDVDAMHLDADSEVHVWPRIAFKNDAGVLSTEGRGRLFRRDANGCWN